jgi:hypothetical protein
LNGYRKRRPGGEWLAPRRGARYIGGTMATLTTTTSRLRPGAVVSAVV